MSDVGSLLSRPKEYYNVDGVGELGIGFMCLSYSLLAWLQMHSPPSAVWHQIYACAIYVAVMLAVIHYGSKAIKEHITYPRTGFVQYRKSSRVWTAVAAGGFAVIATLGLSFAARRHWQISMPGSVVGLLFALTYIRFARTARWKWAAFWVMVAGALIIAALPTELLEAFTNHKSLTSAVPPKAVGAYWLTFIVYGVVLMISGGISLWLYLRQTQPPAQESR